MADEIRVPPEILETFLKIKQLVDEAVEQLQVLPPLQLSASGHGTMTGSVSIEVVGEPASISATARPGVVRGTASIPVPEIIVTEEEVEEARKWVFANSAIAGAKSAAGFFAQLEALLQFIDRLRNLLP